MLIVGGHVAVAGGNAQYAGDCGYRVNPCGGGRRQRSINERIKEELSNGRTVQQAQTKVGAGAFSSIFDANITTLIKVNILYAVGTGAIKGFAITTAMVRRRRCAYRDYRYACYRKPAYMAASASLLSI